MAYMRIPGQAARPSRMLAVGIASTVLRSGRFGSCANWHLSLHLYGSGSCHCIRTAVALVTVRQWPLLLHPYGRGGAQVHLKETRANKPRVIYENLHLAFARMEDATYKISADDKAYVAASPFMQLMLAISDAVPGVKIVVQFSSGVEIHVDYRHLHRTAEQVSPSHSSFSPHAAGSFACPCSMHVPIQLAVGCRRSSCKRRCTATRSPATSLRSRWSSARRRWPRVPKQARSSARSRTARRTSCSSSRASPALFSQCHRLCSLAT